MKKLFAVLAVIILSLAMVTSVYAADENADFMRTVTGSGQISGSCHILGINIRGATTGDNIGVYDWTLARNAGTGIADVKDLEFEMGISANNGSTYAPLYNAPFTYGVYIQASVSTIFTTVLFDY